MRFFFLSVYKILWVGAGGTRGGQGKSLALVIPVWRFCELEVSYVYNGECSSICDAICDRNAVVPGVVLWGRGRGTLEGVRGKV